FPVTDRLCVLPDTVPPNVASDAVSAVSAPSVTPSLYVCVPVVRTTPPLIAVVPPALVVTLVSGVVPPTAAENVVVPVLLTTRSFQIGRASGRDRAPLPALTVRLLFSVVVLPNS